MQERSYLLFGEDRWALAQRFVLRVEGVHRENTPDALCLSAWGIDLSSPRTSGHILRIATPSFQLSLLVYGHLKPLQVEPDQVIELPVSFFGSSAATALILREDHESPALLLDPVRLNSRLSAGGVV
jgi:hypothetical protein